MMPVMASALLESIEILAGGCRAFTEKCVVGIQANLDRCRELLERNPALATALNLRLGYEGASEIAEEAAREGLTVREVVLRGGSISEEEVDEVLDVEGMTEGGLRKGR
jgi:fumarate hydratase class II